MRQGLKSLQVRASACPKAVPVRGEYREATKRVAIFEKGGLTASLFLCATMGVSSVGRGPFSYYGLLCGEASPSPR